MDRRTLYRSGHCPPALRLGAAAGWRARCILVMVAPADEVHHRTLVASQGARSGSTCRSALPDRAHRPKSVEHRPSSSFKNALRPGSSSWRWTLVDLDAGKLAIGVSVAALTYGVL